MVWFVARYLIRVRIIVSLYGWSGGGCHSKIQALGDVQPEIR